MHKYGFNLQVTVNSFDDKRHDVTVQARDSDGITRHISSKALDNSGMSDSIKFTIDEVVDKVVDIMLEK